MAFGFVSRLLVISASPDHVCTNEPSFLQGDKEAELGLPFSPLCDRKSTMVAQSQIGNAEDRGSRGAGRVLVGFQMDTPHYPKGQHP